MKKKIMKVSKFILSLLILCNVQMTFALDEVVSVKDVIASTFKHHPLILAQVKELNLAEQKLTQATGAFDLNLKGSGEGYTDGYYDGKAFNAFLEKPLYYMNSKAYGGYRKSEGEFPIYTQEVITQNRGELFAGVMVSLLRNNTIDYQRFNRILAEQDMVQSQIYLNQQFIELQTMAANAYYKWLTDLEKVRVQSELLDLAVSRVKSFDTRIRKGDLAKIYGVENEQYILRRRTELNSNEQKLYESALYLSLYLRDENGVPIILKSSNPSKIKDIKSRPVKNANDLLNVVNQQDLEIKAYESQRVQADADRRMGANDLLPKLDVKYEVSEDQGDPVTNLEPFEQKVYLNLEIPIERRLGAGRRNAAKAKQEALNFKINFKREKNQIEVLSLLNNLRLYKSNFDLTQKEIELSDKLREAEIVKFYKGASDFILVNLREESLAESKIKNLTAYLDYHLNFVELQRLAVDFIVPPTKPK